MSLAVPHATHSPRFRKALVVLAVAFAILTPAIQALLDLGLSQREFADAGNETLRAAGYAFSIWTLIYAGLIAHAVQQVVDRGRHEPLFVALKPSIAAIAGCGLWIVASALNERWLSVVVILASAGTALWALMRARGVAQGLKSHLWSVWPIALLGGWLLIASAVNILTVMTAEGMIGADLRTAYGLLGITAVAAVTIGVMRAGVSFAYGLPVAWGLVAVFAAERSDQPATAFPALGAAVIVLAASGWIELKRRAAR